MQAHAIEKLTNIHSLKATLTSSGWLFLHVNAFMVEHTASSKILNCFVFRISYWNSDKERLIILCENVMIICKYDFVATKIVSVTRIYLKTVKQMQEGAFSYPDNSVIT